MRITDVSFERVRGTWDYRGPLGEDRGPSPLEIYPEQPSTTRSWPIPNVQDGPPYPLEALFLHVDTDEGVSGIYGPVRDDDAKLVASNVAKYVIGENPHAVERIWDKCYLANVTGRKGPIMQAISKMDLALWDLKGKLLGAPVHELLGGPTRSSIRAYASMLGYSTAPERVHQRSAELATEGYTAIKWFLRHGHAAGPEGMRANLAQIRAAREGAGPDVELMFDAWKSWNVPYAQRMAELAAPCRPWWFEEPVMPDMIDAYAEIRRTVSNVAISGGEHEYTRWGMKALLDAGAVDILQPDPSWVGGLSEMVKICALASANGIPVIPHHGGIASSHLIASQPPTTCPIQEWILQAGRRDNHFLMQKIEPVSGEFALPTGPGLGIVIDDDAVNSREPIAF
jgi:L-rhamnonate dehydratase